MPGSRTHWLPRDESEAPDWVDDLDSETDSPRIEMDEAKRIEITRSSLFA